MKTTIPRIGTKRAALYLRVSTEEQTTMNQIVELESLARARNWTIVQVVQETASGVSDKRPEFARIMGFAHRGAIDVVAVWALDRIGRSMSQTIRHVLELERCGIELVSLREPWLDTGGPVRPLLVAIFAWVADQERARLVERTRAGMARARAAGVKLGHASRLEPAKVKALRAQGLSLRAVAKELETSYSAVRRAIAR